VAANRFTEIGALADAGVEAIIVPLVSSVAEAEAAVAALDYPSRGGDRSWGPTAELIHGAVKDTRDERPLLFVMIESAARFAAVDDICAVPGIDVVYVGPSVRASAVGARPGQLNGALAGALVRLRAAEFAAVVLPGIDFGVAIEASLPKYQVLRFFSAA